MQTKQTACKCHGGLPKATFPTGMKECCRHYGSHLKIKIGKVAVNRIPSYDEEEPGEWSDLTPLIPSSPEVLTLSTFVDKLNSRCPVPVTDTPPHSPAELTISKTLELLHEMEARDSAPGSPVPILHTPPRSPFEEGMIEDLPAMEQQPIVVALIEEAVTSTTEGTSAEASQEEGMEVTCKTVSEVSIPPVTICPRFPTAAKKCPRKEFRDLQKSTQQAKKPLQPPKTLTALQEIRKMQSTFDDILLFAPFSRLIRELSCELVEMRFTREAIQAFRSEAEAYLLEIFEKANIACMHAGRCTLQPKDIRVVRRILDHDVTLGCTKESIDAWKFDLVKYRAKHLTYKQAKTMEATRRAKLRKIA